MSKSFFVSDIHFGLQSEEAEDRKIERFAEFAGMVSREKGSLYMVGDILDYWMEFRHVIPKYFNPFLCLLREMIGHGVDIHYFAGNHDFWLGSYFGKVLGVRTYYGAEEPVIEGKHFYITHGDGLDPKDIGYRLFVSLFRNRFNLALFSAIQPDIAIGLMRKLSRLSRNHGGSNRHYEADFLFQYADSLAENKAFDFFVCGHSHMKSHKKLSNGRSDYVNLGTWTEGEYPYGVFENERFSLQQLK